MVGNKHELKVGMLGAGMIFDETYLPAFADCARRPIVTSHDDLVRVRVSAIGSKTGKRAAAHLGKPPLESFTITTGELAVDELLKCPIDIVCIATPDDQHFQAARKALRAGKHVMIEKPSVLSLAELDELEQIAAENHVLAKVVYHKLLDPDHKKLRTLVNQQVLKHVNHGYCSLLEPKSIALEQFAPWIAGRNPATYVAVHYLKLIDFTFFHSAGRLKRIKATGQRGLVRGADSDTWDSVQTQVIYEHADGREAAFDIHTSWVHPDNFPGYVEQEVQFRFDDGVWNGHSRKRGVELTVDQLTPLKLKNTLNNHYNAAVHEPWHELALPSEQASATSPLSTVQRGYGVEVIRRFFEEVAELEFGPAGDPVAHSMSEANADRRTDAGYQRRLRELRALRYNDLTADRPTVAIVQAIEAILSAHANGKPDAVVHVDHEQGGLVMLIPGSNEHVVLYSGSVYR